MKLTHLKNSAIDRHAWDKALANANVDQVYPYSWWLDVVSPNWEALVAEDYSKVMPLTGKSKLGTAYLAQPWLTQQLGVFGAGATPNEITNQFLGAIPEKYKLVEICLNSENAVSLPYWEKRELVNVELNISGAYPTIRQGYSTNLKRNIAKAEKAGLQMEDHTEGIEHTIALFQTHRPQESKALGGEYFDVLRKIVAKLEQKKMAKLVRVISSTGELLSSALFVNFAGRLIFLFSGNSAQGKQLGALPFLIDRVILEFSGKATTLDFEGSVNPGLARFYLGFGGEQKNYLQVKINRLPAIVKWIKP